ncbi:hypothetical protein [Nocardia sp. NPDC058666]|uniref:hypothetical protein n=1 Tax=Nocardia sp. NPDC058666 TaxID=3346587 RepID=UPI00364D94F5
MYHAADQRPATGGTAITAAVLAVLGALAGLGGAVSIVRIMVLANSVFWWGLAPTWASVAMALALIVEVVAAVLLFTGAILIFRRRHSGPTLTVLGCIGVVGAYAVSVVTTLGQMAEYGDISGRSIQYALRQTSVDAMVAGTVETDLPTVVSVLLLGFPLVTFALAVLPSTRRWCRGVRQSAWGSGAPMPPHGVQPAMYRPGMPPVPGYGPPPGQWGQSNQPPQQRHQHGNRP